MHSLAYLSLASLFSTAYGALSVVPPTGDCTLEGADGKLKTCASCLLPSQFDGSSSSYCLIKDDKDIGHPFCDASHTIILGSGLGKSVIQHSSDCSTSTNPSTGEPYQWVQSHYQWKCCACPAGYQPAGAYSPGADGIGGFTYDISDPSRPGQREKTCMKCTGDGEKLTWNANTWQWYCAGGSPVTTTTTTTTPGGGHPPTKSPVPVGGNCNINKPGSDLIKKAEQFHKSWYILPDGSKAIGYGHSCNEYKDCATITAPITPTKAAQILDKDLNKYEACIKTLPNVSILNINQFSALVSFAYDQGCAATKSAFGSKMQGKQFAAIGKALSTTAAGTPALKARREAEAKLFNTATTVKSGCKES